MQRMKWLIPIVLLITASLMITGCDNPREEAAEEAREVDMQEVQEGMADAGFIAGPLRGDLPEGWESVPPSSNMRVAEINLEPAEGAADEAQVTVFYFGPQAGSVDMNISRWMGQFEKADGGALTEADVELESIEAHGLEATMIQFKGTQKPSSMPGAPATEEKPDYMNVSAIVSTPQGPWFFKGTGPEATMLANLDEFEQFIQSLEYQDPHQGMQMGDPHEGMDMENPPEQMGDDEEAGGHM